MTLLPIMDFLIWNIFIVLNKEPHLAQIKQLAIILPKNLGKLNNYMPYSPWKKEIRTASNVDVLNSSIEKNSINFWWVRVFHWTTSKITRFPL
jgi:hypothetical protein